jgi:AcrR family transcriptional regulator
MVLSVSTAPLSGRRAEASRNDERVLAAAREVLTASPGAPMAEIARRAGVGIGTLYRRYPSKEALVQHLCLDGMQRLEAAARTALEQVEEDAWEAFTGFMTAGLAAGAGSLGAALAGTFTPSDELLVTARSLYATVQQLLERAQAAGAVRADITQEDVTLIFEQLRAVKLGDADRVASLQRRYLALGLQALRAPGAAPLPGPPPGWDEIRSRWTT